MDGDKILFFRRHLKEQASVVESFHGNLPQLCLELPVAEIDVHLYRILNLLRKNAPVQFRNVLADWNVPSGFAS